MANDGSMATVTDLLRRSQNALLGKYRAVVVDNADPERRGRIKLSVPSVFADQATDWVPGAFPLGGNGQEALMAIPAIGSHALVEFIEGDRSSPIWTATYHPTDSASARPPDEFDLPQGGMHLLRTRSGLMLRLEDDGGATQQVVLSHPGGAEIRIDKDGIVTVTDQAGGGVTLDPQGRVVRLDGHGDGALAMEDGQTTLSHGATKLVLSASGARVEAPTAALDADSVTLGKNAASPILNAQSFATFFDAHLHAPGSPPAPPSSPALAGLTLLKVKGA